MKKYTPMCNICVFMMIIAWLAMPLTACAAAPSTETGDAVAIVNGEPIDKKTFDTEFEQAMNQIRSKGQQPNDEQVQEIKERILNNLIHHAILVQESGKKNISVGENEIAAEWDRIKAQFPGEKEFMGALRDLQMTEKKLREKIRQNFAVRELLETEVVRKVVVSSEELSTFYNSQPELFEEPEQVRASHILIQAGPDVDDNAKEEALNTIRKIQTELQEGSDFADLARARSDCPSGAKGGDLGFFGRGQMAKPFEEAAFALKADEVSDVVATQFGYHLIKAFEKKAGRTVPLDEIKDQLEGHLKQRKTKEAVEAYVEQLKARAKIETLLNL